MNQLIPMPQWLTPDVVRRLTDSHHLDPDVDIISLPPSKGHTTAPQMYEGTARRLARAAAANHILGPTGLLARAEQIAVVFGRPHPPVFLPAEVVKAILGTLPPDLRRATPTTSPAHLILTAAVYVQYQLREGSLPGAPRAGRRLQAPALPWPFKALDTPDDPTTATRLGPEGPIGDWTTDPLDLPHPYVQHLPRRTITDPRTGKPEPATPEDPFDSAHRDAVLDTLGRGICQPATASRAWPQARWVAAVITYEALSSHRSALPPGYER